MYRNIIAILFVMLALLTPLRSTACGEIIPPQEVVVVASRYAHKDYPTLVDILAFMWVESSFNSSAKNPNHKVPGSSNGIMQVNHGPFELEDNIAAGVKIARLYYRMTGSKEGATKAYNIGIGNYLNGKMTISAEEYYQKFKLARRIYEKYPREVRYLGNDLGCSVTGAKWDKYLGRPTGSNLLLPYQGAGGNNLGKRKAKSNKGQPT